MIKFHLCMSQIILSVTAAKVQIKGDKNMLIQLSLFYHKLYKQQ